MTKRIVGVFLAILFVVTAVSCNSPATPDPLAMQTDVAGTLQAHSQSTDSPEPYGLVLKTATPGPTYTPVPTLMPRNLIDSIVDDVRLKEYCNKDLVPEIIKEFRLIYEKSSGADGVNNGNLDITSVALFASEEDQVEAIEVVQAIADEIDSIKVPECLESAKTKILLGYEEMLKVFERNDSNWFPDFMAAGFIGQSGWDELDRIEKCLPTGCK